MASLLEDFVVMEENRQVFDEVYRVTEDHDAPVRLFISGPHGSGKTTLLQGRGRDRDLLSTKEVVFCHSVELVSFFNLGEVGEQFLQRVGDADVLLIDGFDEFFNGEEIGPALCKLLVKARTQMGKDTLIFSVEPLDSFDLTELEGALDGFEERTLVPLDEAGREELVRRAQKSAAGRNEQAPQLDDDAVAFLANGWQQDLAEVRNAIKFLVTAAGFEDGHVITADECRMALEA